MSKPETKYARSGRISIAYQVFGSGQTDLVYVPGWVSNIDLMWQNRQLSNFLSRLGQYARVILFDKRGTGLSDRVTELSTLEERMDDIRAVMSAVGSSRAILFGHSEGGSVSALFAATYPERTISLITFGVFAKRRYSPDYPWAPTDKERKKVYDMIESSWGSSEMDLTTLAPSMAGDQEFMDWLASYFRSGASPSAALVLTKMNTQVDIIDILDTIEVPTLLLYRTDDIDVKIDEGLFISERIKGSKFIEFPGHDHLFWVGDSDSVLNEMIHFINQKQLHQVFDRVLATILQVKLVGLEIKRPAIGDQAVDQLQIKINQIIAKKIKQYRGSVAGNGNSIITATFDGPSKAVHCAIEIRTELRTEGIFVSQGIHIGECIQKGSQELGGRAIKVTDDVLARTKMDEIVITNTVYNLLSGAGLDFTHREHIRTFDGTLVQTLLLRETTDPSTDFSMQENELSIQNSTNNHSFLENVLQSIENHLHDEQYSIPTLCMETGTGERQLQRKLKAITNKSPNQLIRSVRLHRAKEMMLLQNKSISEVAFMTGFNSLSYFTKCFKKEFGRLPSDMTK
ncbi:MAG: alpha/beta fold hydrolase [Saprospiraceae bacterium]|nr:alpha/beta fold hydrolase [Saprospiraceae bacterium]